MNRSVLLLFAVLFIAVPEAWSQDLDRLLERVSGLWLERGRGDSVKAAQYVDAPNRKAFPMYEMVREPVVDGFQFSGDKTKVLVSVRGKAMLPGVGEVRQALVETWVWTGGNWFVRPEGDQNPFEAFSKNAAAKAVAFNFELLNKKLDLGNYKQGEIISGKVGFKAPQKLVEVIRARGIPGLRVKNWDWTDENSGTINFTIDTSLLWENVAQEIVFDALGPMQGFERLNGSDRAMIAAQIEGKVRIRQLPATADSKADGFVELEMENLGDTQFTVLAVRHPASVSPGVGLNGIMVAPGQTILAAVYYTNKAQPEDAELTFHFTSGVLPSNSLIFRLAGPEAPKTDAPPAAGLTRGQIEALIQQQNPEIQRLQQQIQQQQNPR